MCVCSDGVYFIRSIPQTVGPIAGPSCSLGKHNGSFSSRLYSIHVYLQCSPTTMYATVSYYSGVHTPAVLYVCICMYVCICIVSSTTDHWLLFCLWGSHLSYTHSPLYGCYSNTVIHTTRSPPCMCVCILVCFGAMIGV